MIFTDSSDSLLEYLRLRIQARTSTESAAIQTDCNTDNPPAAAEDVNSCVSVCFNEDTLIYDNVRAILLQYMNQ